MENLTLSKLLGPIIIFGVCCGLLILLVVLQKRIAKKQGSSSGLFLRNIRVPIQIFILLTILYVASKMVDRYSAFHPTIEHIYSILATLCLGWLAIKTTHLISLLVLHHFNIQEHDNYRARQVHTRVRVLRRLAIAFIVAFVIVGILVSFESVRAQWSSLLASAGLLSILVGLAAQKTMGNFFAGLQIAIAQPIRVDDVVVVENEWGRIEEIRLTYVIVKLWDLRRLIVPITHFTDRIFQNWTQKTADILGTVMLYVDYTLPVELIRKELDRLLDGNPLWDGKVKAVQVTNATEHTMEIRILTSSPDASASFDLRCAIREHMISFIQKTHPSALPRLRISSEPKP